jgi:hypothetical protein
MEKCSHPNEPWTSQTDLSLFEIGCELYTWIEKAKENSDAAFTETEK